MPYVMVPVPEEHEAELGRFVLEMQVRDVLNAWTDAEIRTLYDQLLEPAKAVLVAVAERVVNSTQTTNKEVAIDLDMTPAEVFAQALAVGEACEDMTKGPLLLLDPGPDAIPESNTTVVRKFMLSPRFARAVLAASAAAPSPPST